MKILYLTTHLNLGGISRYILTVGSALRARGHEVFVASGGGDLEHEFRESGVQVKAFPIRTKSELSPKLYGALPEVTHWVKKEKIDLIHAHNRVTQVLAFFIRLSTGIPFVTTVHGFYERRLGRRLLPAWGNRAIAISEPVAEELMAKHRVAASRVRVVYNGIDIEGIRRRVLQQDPRAARREYGMPEDAVILGIIARLISEKGHEYLIRALKGLDSEFPKLRLLIVGEGRERDRLESLTKGLGLNGSVRFTGNLKDISKPLAVTDIFVHPATWREAFGLSVVEAMVCEKPVVVTNTWALSSLIKERVNGIIVEPRDEQSLREAIRLLVKNAPLRKEMGKAGSKSAEERFSIERMAKELETVYEEVLKE